MEEKNTQERATALYSYLRELVALRSQSHTNINNYPWKLYLSDLAFDQENIEIFSRDRTDEESEEDNPILVKIHKPEYTHCPLPSAKFLPWLKDGWQDFHNEVELSFAGEGADIFLGRFADDSSRVEAFEKWNSARLEWQNKQYTYEKTRQLFMELYQVYTDANRDIETMEVVVANGFLLDSQNPGINHPVITRRVTINFNAFDNTISVSDLDVDTELYTVIFREINGIDANAIPEINDELKANDYHPMDRIGTSDFLKTAIRRLSSDSFYTEAGIPEDWEGRGRFILSFNPVFIYRKRLDGTGAFIQKVIDNIEATGNVPEPVSAIVTGGKATLPEDSDEITVEEQLAAVGGESVDILLSKAANKEQLEIAERIEKHSGVLVQGPPGTGKTHTIANLLGHFLAQGKSVLVTSHTPKALQVLKDKLSDDIKPLCVSVLDDKNQDMERSVDSISDFMSRYTASELEKKAERLREIRDGVIAELAEKRRQIYSVIKAECTDIVYDGKSISPSDAAAYVFENQDKLSFIPGKVKRGEPFPLTYTELISLYRSNGEIEAPDEKEINCDLPDVQELLSPDEFTALVAEYTELQGEKEGLLSNRNGWSWKRSRNGVLADIGHGDLHIVLPDAEQLNGLYIYVCSFGKMEEWMKYAAIDGQRSGAYLSRWEKLIAIIETAVGCREKLTETGFGRELECTNYGALIDNEENFEKLRELYSKKGKVSKLDLLFNKDLAAALELVKVDGKKIASCDDCDFVLAEIRMRKANEKCGKYWDELIAKHNSVKYCDLSADEPEQVAQQWIETIKRSLTVFTTILDNINAHLSVIGLGTTDVFVAKKEDTAIQITENVLSAMADSVPVIVRLCCIEKRLDYIADKLDAVTSVLRSGKRTESEVCCRAELAIDSKNADDYENAYKRIEELHAKFTLQRDRIALLNRIALVAPDWAEAIRSRKGIHGENTVPESIEDAWKWKQYSAILSDMAGENYDVLQSECTELGNEYRRITGEYSGALAWYHLLKRTESDIGMRQALNGWKLTVRKIGKGTGKTAPRFKEQARKLMSGCQQAVPAWIMPMGKVTESLDPRTNTFDIIIVDEASQSDVSSLGVMYLGKKVIIVGDDKQVSPLAIGTVADKTVALEKMYIKDVIPNSHLFGANTSLYDIAATTYHPLMLREHFRCVPDIIGFSNGLSYDYRIKPLRDAGASKLLPAVVNVRTYGERQGKINVAEADRIVALIKACLNMPEYADKTFGVISLLGDDQPNLIMKRIFSNIELADIEKHRILCGNSSQFQGDERDVIFLSMVDSPSDDGPLPKIEFGAGELMRKRYNVAASRARDQLWVVDSLDPAKDLKEGDIRRRLIEYSMNPDEFLQAYTGKNTRPESAFEAEVADRLAKQGYSVKRNMSVGGYCLCTVVESGIRHVAIECDGDSVYGGEAGLRDNMERQTILERSGWKFIRVRGSEYYLCPEKCMERVYKRLAEAGFEPTDNCNDGADTTQELAQKVICAAAELVNTLNQY